MEFWVASPPAGTRSLASGTGEAHALSRAGKSPRFSPEAIPLAGVVAVDAETLEPRDLGEAVGLTLLILIRHRF